MRIVNFNKTWIQYDIDLHTDGVVPYINTTFSLVLSVSNGECLSLKKPTGKAKSPKMKNELECLKSLNKSPVQKVLDDPE